MLREILNAVAGALVIIAYFPYIRAIFKKSTRPSKATWIIWMVLNFLTMGGMLQSGTVNAQIAVVTLGDVVIVALAFRHGMPGWTQVEKGCLVGAALGFLVWAFTKHPLAAISIGLGITVIGAIPTVVKVWSDPRSENAAAYKLMFASCLVQIAAIPAWTWADALQPIVFFCTSGTILYLILTRPPKKPIKGGVEVWEKGVLM